MTQRFRNVSTKSTWPMFAKEKSGFAVMQYVDDGSVRVSVDSMALDNAAAASGFVGTFAPHAIATSGNVAPIRKSRMRLRRPVRNVGHPDYTEPAFATRSFTFAASARQVRRRRKIDRDATRRFRHRSTARSRL